MDFSNLSADAAHRFRIVAELIHAHGQSLPDTPTLLDVGGYPGLFVREFTSAWPRWKGTTLDRPREDLPNYVSGSGMRIPFDDNTFDVVATIDTFEHVPAADRRLFLSELCRVSKGLVVLAAPFHHPATEAVERLLDNIHEQVFQAPHPWLHEHVSFGLPKLMDTIDAWPMSHGVVDVRGSYDLQTWLTWQAMSLFRKLRGEADNAWRSFDAASAGNPTPRVNQVPYRRVIVAKKDMSPTLIQANLNPPPDAGAEVVELARFYCRILEVSTTDVEKNSAAGPILVEQRMKEALVSAEKRILELEGQLSGRLGPKSGIFAKFLGK